MSQATEHDKNDKMLQNDNNKLIFAIDEATKASLQGNWKLHSLKLKLNMVGFGFEFTYCYTPPHFQSDFLPLLQSAIN